MRHQRRVPWIPPGDHKRGQEVMGAVESVQSELEDYGYDYYNDYESFEDDQQLNYDYSNQYQYFDDQKGDEINRGFDEESVSFQDQDNGRKSLDVIPDGKIDEKS